MDNLIKAQAYINGHWINSSNGKSFDVINPATGVPIGRVPDMERSDVTKAIRAAENAFEAWSSRTGKERAKILRKWFESVVSSTESLARIITLESGKPLAESRSEVAYGASFIEWFAEEAKRIYGDTIPATDKNKRIITIRQPVGVSAAITPWNFPLAMITRKASPALAAGCTMVIKPAEATPLTALALAQLAEEAEIPAGVFNIITSLNSSETGKEFCENPTIRKLSFTGSKGTGRILAAQCAGTVKKLS
ncbi:aldehyde dehydrogenase family protein, partial [Agriterribacter sp.]|uniref:aldehyde dehydrogenase family protein n=1 Tax=Agriterribacter sp. TaxID=2821509 RepID=UPI002C98E8E1